jgi:hypothetical protein
MEPLDLLYVDQNLGLQQSMPHEQQQLSAAGVDFSPLSKIPERARGFIYSGRL